MEKKKGRFWLPLIISMVVYVGIRIINVILKVFFFIIMFIVGDLMNNVFDVISAAAVIAGIIIVVYKTRNIFIFPIVILITELVIDIFLYVQVIVSQEKFDQLTDIMGDIVNTEGVVVEQIYPVTIRPFLFFGIALGIAAIAKLIFDRIKKKTELV